MATRPAIFKWPQTEPVLILILCAVRWYSRYPRCEDVEELLDERGLQADHTTVWPLGAAVRSRPRAAHPAASQTDQ
jgi:transposase, IS6 family